MRGFSWYAGMRHYPGWWWCSTSGDLVGYESLLERDRLMLADFDRDVVAIASQPFGITGRIGDAIRRHVPDYLLHLVDGTVVVVDVKPAELVDKPKVALVLDWTAELMAERGWRYEVWSGAQEIRLTNVRFLGVGRRRDRVDPAALSALAATAVEGSTLTDALAAAHDFAGAGRAHLRAALLALLWQQVWMVDLDAPLTGDDPDRADQRGCRWPLECLSYAREHGCGSTGRPGRSARCMSAPSASRTAREASARRPSATCSSPRPGWTLPRPSRRPWTHCPRSRWPP